MYDTVGPTNLEWYNIWNDAFCSRRHNMFLEHDSIWKKLHIHVYGIVSAKRDLAHVFSRFGKSAT